MAERYSLIFESEIEALKQLSGNAAKALIFLKFGGAEDRAAGCRQVADGTGLSKDQAARALRDLVEAGLLKITHAGRYGRKGNVSKYQITHTPASKRDENQSRKCDTPERFSRTGVTERRKSVAPARLKPNNQSHQRDTLKNASSASPQRRKDEEEEGFCDDQIRHNAEVEANRQRSKRIHATAASVGLSGVAMMNVAGGPQAADFLARKFSRGELSVDQLRARLAEKPTCFRKEIGAIDRKLSSTSAGNAPLAKKLYVHR